MDTPSPPRRSQLEQVLDRLSYTYAQARRENDDLQLKLRALQDQMDRYPPMNPSGEGGSRGGRMEVERARRSVERSAFGAAERLRALELVISSCVGEAGRLLGANQAGPATEEPSRTGDVRVSENAQTDLQTPPEDGARTQEDVFSPTLPANTSDQTPGDPVRGSWIPP